MNILHISHLYPVYYDLFWGKAVHNLIKSIASQGCKVQVVSPVPYTPFPISYLSKEWKLYSKIPNYEIIEGIEVYRPRYVAFPRALYFSSSGIRMYHGIKRLIKDLHKDFTFDLIHAHMALPDGYAGMILSQRYNKPLVVTLRATDIDITAKRSKKCFQALTKVFNFATRVIAPSPRLSKAFRSLFGREVSTICNGIYPEEICPLDKGLRSKYGERQIILSVARLIPTKGIDIVLYALKELVKKYSNLLYLIIGDGPMKQSLMELVSNLYLDKHVEFLGQLSHQETMKYMSICDIFVLPSWQETFGLVYIEAMAHAKPVIGVQGQGVDGIIHHGYTGFLVRPKDKKSLVKAIDYLLGHPDEAKKIGERARKLILENCTWGKNAQKTIEVYEEALKSE